MARKRNYDDYGYDNEYEIDTGSIIKKAIVIVMIVIAIILIIYLIKGCSRRAKDNKKNPDTPKPSPTELVDYESDLLEAGRKHFNTYKEELPTVAGECSVVDLRTLVEKSEIDASKFDKCNLDTTYIKVCALENNVKQYTPWLSCSDYNSEEKYDVIKSGTISDVVTDQTYVEFKYLPQAISASSTKLGPVEEIWQDEIKYESYNTLASTKYYRYRDKLFIWELTTRNYYTRSGIKTNPNQVTEYYKSSPSSGYKLSSDKTNNAYKWYKSSSRREYYMVNGAKMPSTTPVGEYTIRDPNGFDATRYRTRSVTGTYDPTKYYACSTSSSSPIIKYQTVPCGQGLTPEFNYQKEVFYTCAEDIELVRTSPRVSATSKCYRYSSWSDLTTTACNTNNTNTCESITLTFYYWYKNTDDVRTYYPSGSASASGENVYYVSEPFKGAIKDTSTRATAYKWYNEKIQTTSTYSAVAPSGYTSTKKTSDYKWSDWSNWSTTNPKVSDSREREIETKTKIKLQEIQGQTEESWQNLSEDYISENELINMFKQKGYKVNTLEDVLNNGQIRYQLKLFVRNKKESK